jgi:hypothetical protein
VCVTNDFFQSTRGDWSTNDLMLLKTTLSELGVSIKGPLCAQTFFNALLKNRDIIERFFQGIPTECLSELSVSDSPLMKGLEKICVFDTDEHYIIESVLALLKKHREDIDTHDVYASLLRHYLLEKACVQVEREVTIFDFVIELLIGLRMVVDLSQSQSDENLQAPQAVKLPSEEFPAEHMQHMTPQDFRILGLWQFEWHRSRSYSSRGTLKITRKVTDNLYAGTYMSHFENPFPAGHNEMAGDAELHMQETHITIRWLPPSPDSRKPTVFEVILDPYDDVMTGHSQAGEKDQEKIIFTKQRPQWERIFPS